MTLQELIDRLDWSAIDQAEAAWVATHAATQPALLDPAAKAYQRRQRVLGAYAALHGDAPRALWDILPHTIQAQIRTLYAEAGLLDPTAPAPLAQAPGASDTKDTPKEEPDARTHLC